MNNYKKLYLGKKDGIKYYLDGASRDCEQYWGAGYITSKEPHEHFDSSGMVYLIGWNNKDGILDSFSNALEKEENRRDLIAFYKHVYHLKERAEFLKNGGHVNKTSIVLLDMLGTKEEREKEIELINKKLLPGLFEQIEEKYSTWEKLAE